MAQRGWLTKQHRKKKGTVWVYHWYVTKPETGRKAEHTCVVGAVSSFPREKDVWHEVDRRHLQPKPDQSQLRSGRLTFGDLAASYVQNGLKKLAETTQYTVQHNIDDYLVPRWGTRYALEIQPLEIEQWLDSSRARKSHQGQTASHHVHHLHPGTKVWTGAARRIVKSSAMG